MTHTKLTPIPPGETLHAEVIEPLGLSVNQLARALAVDAARLNDLIRGLADAAIRLSRYLGTTAEFWLGLQFDYGFERRAKITRRQLKQRSSPAPRPNSMSANSP